MVRIPGEPVEIGGVKYQLEVSPKVAEVFKGRTRRMGISEEEFLAIIHEERGDLTERVLYDYLKMSG